MWLLQEHLLNVCMLLLQIIFSMKKINGILSFRTSSRTAIIPEPQGNHLVAVFKKKKKKPSDWEPVLDYQAYSVISERMALWTKRISKALSDWKEQVQTHWTDSRGVDDSWYAWISAPMARKLLQRNDMGRLYDIKCFIACFKEHAMHITVK